MAWTTEQMAFFDLVITGTSQSVQVAISNGADVNARNSYGKTPLMCAAEFNQDPEVITTLLDAGADVNAQDNHGKTPLMYATMYNQNLEVITTLLDSGANAKLKDNTGNTAFDDAQTRAKLQGTDTYRRLQEASQ